MHTACVKFSRCLISILGHTQLPTLKLPDPRTHQGHQKGVRPMPVPGGKIRGLPTAHHQAPRLPPGKPTHRGCHRPKSKRSAACLDRRVGGCTIPPYTPMRLTRPRTQGGDVRRRRAVPVPPDQEAPRGREAPIRTWNRSRRSTDQRPQGAGLDRGKGRVILPPPVTGHPPHRAFHTLTEAGVRVHSPTTPLGE